MTDDDGGSKADSTPTSSRVPIQDHAEGTASRRPLKSKLLYPYMPQRPLGPIQIEVSSCVGTMASQIWQGFPHLLRRYTDRR